MHTITIKFDNGVASIEFHEVTPVELLAAAPYLERETQRILFQIEVEEAQRAAGNGSGIVVPSIVPPDLKGRKS